jgi:hypothetical protein
MLCNVALVGTDVSEELSASFIRVKRIGELGTTLAVTSSRRTLRLLQEPHGITSQKTPFFTIQSVMYKPVRHEDVWGNEGRVPSFLTAALEGVHRSG